MIYKKDLECKLSCRVPPELYDFLLDKSKSFNMSLSQFVRFIFMSYYNMYHGGSSNVDFTSLFHDKL